MFEQWTTVTALHQTADWQNHVGEIVEIRSKVNTVRWCIVEEEMPDGSGLWLSADVTDRREYFHKDFGYELWV